jgi:hypothetical protein
VSLIGQVRGAYLAHKVLPKLEEGNRGTFRKEIMPHLIRGIRSRSKALIPAEERLVSEQCFNSADNLTAVVF